MEAKIISVALVVKDKAKALEFYTNKVGFEKNDYTQGSYGYVTVGPKGQDIELSLWQMGSRIPLAGPRIEDLATS